MTMWMLAIWTVVQQVLLMAGPALQLPTILTLSLWYRSHVPQASLEFTASLRMTLSFSWHHLPRQVYIITSNSCRSFSSISAKQIHGLGVKCFLLAHVFEHLLQTIPGVLFGDVPEPLGGRASLEEVGHCGVDIECHNMASLPNLSLLPDPQRCERTVSCSCCYSYELLLLLQWTGSQNKSFFPTVLCIRYFVKATGKLTNIIFNFNKVQYLGYWSCEYVGFLCTS